MSEPPPPDLRELLAVMAHDLRNPLSAILTNLHFVATAVSQRDADAREALEDSMSLCDVLERIIGNLDLLGRTGREAPRAPCCLETIATALVRKQQRQSVLAGVRLDLVAVGPPDVQVLIDRELFARAAENLVSNALEHAPSGTRVEVRLEGGGSEAALCVVDVGTLIPAELRGFAVSPEAHRRGSRRAEVRYGRGLGLFCADIAARAAGARLEIQEEGGRSVLRLVAPTCG